MKLTETQSNFANGVTTPSTVAPRDAAAGSREAKLWEQCCGFEGVFMSKLFEEMRKTVASDGGVLPPSPGRKMMESVADQKLVETLAQRGLVGIADRMYADFVRQTVLQDSADSQPILDRSA